MNTKLITQGFLQNKKLHKLKKTYISIEMKKKQGSLQFMKKMMNWLLSYKNQIK